MVTNEFKKQAGGCGGWEYPVWPVWPTEIGDTVSGALLAFEIYTKRLAAGKQLKIPPAIVSRLTGLSVKLIYRRCQAALAGDVAAWPWTHLSKGRGVPLLPLDELMLEVRWVCVVDLAPFLGIAMTPVREGMRDGKLQAEHRPFRGTARVKNSVLLADAIKFKYWFRLKKLFGRSFPFDEVEGFMALEPLTVARLSGSKLRRHLTTGGT